MTQKLKVYVIHTQSLSIRLQKLNTTLQLLKNLSEECGYQTDIQVIVGPDPHILQGQLETLQKKVSYDKTGDEDFDKQSQILSLEMISNTEKHLEAWKKIVSDTDDLYLVLEDDIVLLKESIDNIKELLNILKSNKEWDLITLGVADNNNLNLKLKLQDFRNNTKIMPSKEAYFIKQNVAKRLLEDFNIYKFTFKIQLSYALFKNKDLKVVYPHKRTTIDGSKIGVFTSSIHSNNVLTFNSEYMQLYNFLNKPKDEIINNMTVIDNIYKSVKVLNSPDFTHIYGLIKIKVDKLDEGEEYLLEAVQLMKQSQGILNGRSDLANNLVELYSQLQNDALLSNNKSTKYSSTNVM
jgi:GR25 family glycosyltransferase involved in LPS biosynthesis